LPTSQLGRRQDAPAEVSWFGRDGWHREKTAQPTALVRQLEQSFGGEVPRLTVTRPTLEDVYLELIGAGAREEEQK
jgi:ABC-2 type transport system ATP-binding protein